MTIEQAGDVVAYLNAAFTRDALEPESVAIWVREVVELHSYDAAISAAKLIGRTGRRFPLLAEFRDVYRAEARRLQPPAISPPPDDTSIPSAVAEWLAEHGYGVIRDSVLIDRPLLRDIEETSSITPNPVWARHLERQRLYDDRTRQHHRMAPPTDEEKHAAIVTLHEMPMMGLLPGVSRALWVEAQRILDESCP